jgi:hypothetical protein
MELQFFWRAAAQSRAMTSLPTNRAFLVQLSADTNPALTDLGGRVEHVSSGRSKHFSSREELWSFVAGVLAEASPIGAASRPEKGPR